MRNTTEIEDILDSAVDSLKSISIYINGTKFSKLGNIKVVMLDFMKRLHSNLLALKIIIPEFSENNTLALPIGLILRTCVTDSLTGFYLLTFSRDEESFNNELNVMSLDYINYLESLTNIEPNFYEGELTEDEKNQLIMSTLDMIVGKYPELIHAREGMVLKRKKPIEVRASSNDKIFPNGKKYTRGVTDLSKFERLFNYPVEGIRSISYLYPLFRFYSQLHHYTILARTLIDIEAEENVRHIKLSLVLILQALNSFGKEVEIPDELLLPFKTNLDKIFSSIEDEREADDHN
jgi:hypothetical protein